MPAVKTKNIALIGLGNIAQIYLNVLPKIEEVTLSAIVEHDRLRSADFGHIHTFETVHEMVKLKDNLHAAIICTPPDTHLPIVESLLNAGIHCLVEKPLALTSAEALKMEKLALQRHLKLTTSAKFRFAKPLVAMSEAIQKEEIGKLQEVICTFSGVLDSKKNWRGNKKESGGGVWMDNGPHALDVVEMFGGSIEFLHMTKCLHEQGAEVEDEVIVEAFHKNKVRSKIILSWNRQIAAPYVICKGNKGALIADWKETFLEKEGERRVIAAGYDKEQAFTSVVRHFLDGKKMAGHGSSALKWIETGYKSFYG